MRTKQFPGQIRMNGFRRLIGNLEIFFPILIENRLMIKIDQDKTVILESIHIAPVRTLKTVRNFL